MSICSVVDANSIAIYQHERIADTPGVGTVAIDRIFSVGHIALDENNFIREQWHATASGVAAGQNILDWVADRMQENKIRIVRYEKNTSLNKTLSDFQMKLGDKVYVFVAVSGEARIIVTDDIDFHDPTKKKCGHAEKEEIKRTKCGPVCQYLRTTYAIAVGNVVEVPALLEE